MQHCVIREQKINCFDIQFHVTKSQSYQWLSVSHFTDEFMVFCPATDLQASIYGSILDSPEVKLLVKAHDLCDCDSSKERMNCCYKVLV